MGGPGELTAFPQELCEMNLAAILADFSEDIDECTRCTWASQIAMAMEYLHSMSIVHRCL